VQFDAEGAAEVLLPMQVKAFAYRGALALEMWVVAVAGDAVESIQGRLAGIGGIRSPRPFDAAALAVSQRTLERLAQSAGMKRWSTRIALREPSAAGATPLLLAGRTLLVLGAPRTAPPRLVDLASPKTFARKLTLRGDGPVWKEDGLEYRETPHLLVRLDRQRRLGWREHPTYLAMREADALLKDVASGKKDAFHHGKSALSRAAGAITDPDVFVEDEKKLAAELIEVRRCRLFMTEAERKGDQPARFAEAQKLIDVIALILAPERETLVTDGERRELEGERKHWLRELERAKR